MQFRKLITLAAMIFSFGTTAQTAPSIGSLYGRVGDWYIYAYRAGLGDNNLFNNNIGCYMTRSANGPYDISVITPPFGIWIFEVPSPLPEHTELMVRFMLDGRPNSSQGQQFVANGEALSTILSDEIIEVLGNSRNLTLFIQGSEDQFSLTGFGHAAKMTRECHDRQGRK